MKITHLVATLLPLSAFANEASAHTRAYKTGHHAAVRMHSQRMLLARSRAYNSYANGPAVERRPTVQYQSPPTVLKDDWPANMILDSFRSHEVSGAGRMA